MIRARDMEIAGWVALALLASATGCIKAYHVVDVLEDGAADGVVMGDAGDTVTQGEAGMDVATDVPPGTDAPPGVDVPRTDSVLADVPPPPMCDGGATLADGACGTPPPIRLVRPLSTATVDSNLPTFRVNVASGVNSVLVTVCAVTMNGNNCYGAQQFAIISAGMNDVQYTTNLAPGVYTWSVAPENEPSAMTPPWEFVVLPQVPPAMTPDAGAPPSATRMSWPSMLDTNMDGLADIVVGSQGLNSTDPSMMNLGEVFLFNGAYVSSTTTTLTATANYMDPSPEMGGEFGATVANIGDVNGDGFGDVAIDRPYGSSVGTVYVALGGLNGLTVGPAIPTTVRSIPGGNAQFGAALAAAGDFDGDGFGDLVVGAPQAPASNETGRAFVYFGGPNGIDASATLELLPGSNPSQFFGTSVAGVGDANGDGFDDIVVGAPGDPTLNQMGQIYIFFGNSQRALPGEAPVFTLTNAAPGDRFGAALASIGDANRDGFGDWVAGAPGAQSPMGGLDVFFGGPPPGFRQQASTLPPVAIQHAGSLLAGGGDVNGDGYPDGCFASDSSVFCGSPGIVMAGGAELQVPTAASGFGRALAMPGDFDGDGYADVVVGAPMTTSSGGMANSGMATVYVGDISVFGSTGAAWDSSLTLAPNMVQIDMFGLSLALARAPCAPVAQVLGLCPHARPVFGLVLEPSG